MISINTNLVYIWLNIAEESETDLEAYDQLCKFQSFWFGMQKQKRILERNYLKPENELELKLFEVQPLVGNELSLGKLIAICFIASLPESILIE